MLVNLIILVILGNLKILVILVNMLILAKLVILQKLFFSAKTGDSVESCDSNASFKTDDTDDSWGPSFLNKVPQTIRARVETPPAMPKYRCVNLKGLPFCQSINLDFLFY